MKLESWVEQYLKEDIELESLLASYNRKPAVFYQEAPSSTILNWKNGKKYPQIHYIVHKKEEKEGYTTGTVRFRILCSKDDDQLVRIEQILKSRLEHMIRKEEEEPPVYLTWSETKALKQREKEGLESNIAGLRVFFSFIELPGQTNLDPDPVQSFSFYLKEQMPDCIIPEPEMEEGEFQIDPAYPVIYTRFSDLKITEETNRVIWLEGNLSIHILTVGQEARIRWMMILLHLLSSAGEITMLDHSPMKVSDVHLDGSADYQKEGQLTVSVSYGLPRYTAKKCAITSVGVANSNL